MNPPFDVRYSETAGKTVTEQYTHMLEAVYAVSVVATHARCHKCYGRA